MRISAAKAIARGARFLAEHGIERSRFEAELLLAFVLGVERLDLYKNPEQPLDKQAESRFWELLERRGRGEPFAYLCGEKEFFGLALAVNRSVLIPRPETEQVVEAALEKIDRNGKAAEPLLFFDVGTGSGAIAVAILANRPRTKGYASDISREALEVAKRNAERHGLGERIEFIEGDLFGDFRGEVDLVVSNPPYVGDNERGILPRDVRSYEPEVALFPGGDGLSVIRRLIKEAPSRIKRGGWLIFEIGNAQDGAVGEMLEKSTCWANVEIRNDLSGIPRVAIAQKL